MIDTHAHLTDEKFEGKLSQMISDFEGDGLDYVFTVGTDMQTSKKALEIAENNEKVFAIVGVHPDDLDTLNAEELEQYLSHPKVLAVGEIGLDYHFVSDNKERQKEVFVKQMELAHKYHLPIIVHSRDAVGDTLKTLKENAHLLTDGGVWHCFNESYEVFKEIKKLGFIVSLGGVTTFKNARNSTYLIENLELTDFVLETDCPYLTPEPLRGKVVNEPKYVKYTARHIADIKETNVENIIKATNENVYRIFKRMGRHE